MTQPDHEEHVAPPLKFIGQTDLEVSLRCAKQTIADLELTLTALRIAAAVPSDTDDAALILRVRQLRMMANQLTYPTHA